MKMNKKLFLLFLILANHSMAQNKLNLEDIWKNNAFGSKAISGINSLKDGLHYTILINSGQEQFIVKYNYQTGNAVDTLYNSSKVKNKIPKVESYKFSADENQLLFSTEEERIYRHSYKSNYIIYHILNRTWSLLSNLGKQQLASFSPDSKNIAFVRNNNLYVVDLINNIELQITRDGEKNKIINGASDWVYEEEFAFDKAYEWSPDGKKIAYYRFDESEVKEFSMPTYGSLYPENSTFKYPKAGEKNAIVQILMYDLNSKKNIKANIGDELDQYIPRIKWTNNPTILSCQRLNRLQNKLDLLFVDASTGNSKIILNETSSAYIDVTNDLTFLKDNTGFIWSSELGGFNHLYHYDLNGKLINQITKGNWDIIAYKGYDEKSRTLYFTAAYSSSINKEVCKISLDGTNFKVLSEKKGYNEPYFSSTFEYFINAQSDANHPTIYSLLDKNGKQVRILEENMVLMNKLKGYELIEKEFFVIKTKDGFELNSWMIKPINFDAKKQYPVIFVIYGGPGKNTVVNSWEGASYLWHQYLSQKGYIVVSVDNRGTEFKGEKFKKSTYGNLGMFETMDQIEAAQYFASLPYVDKSRIGIQGWSFGGYLSSLCITKGSEIFKSAIAVAPVTNWRYYDSIYTERFLGLPKDNAKGYDENSPINYTNQLKGNYLLIHGTADDNVHFQNSVEMVTALQKSNKQFDFMMYPDKNHGISGGNARLHIYTLMTDFILEKL
ncbi:MAG TPA: S9 family peptidase [Bacteroidia bacterium]|nr:S9 family peptidase [Bacteroidia bacterium]